MLVSYRHTFYCVAEILHNYFIYFIHNHDLFCIDKVASAAKIEIALADNIAESINSF